MWNVGPTGVSYFEFSVPDRTSASNVIMKMFKKTLAADVEVMTNVAQRIYRGIDRSVVQKNDFKVFGVTSDDRVAELIEEVANHVGADQEKPEDFDMVVYVLSTGSPDYLEWVKNQTEAQETAEDSFQDIKPADLYKETFG